MDIFGGLRRGRKAALADYQASGDGAAATRLAGAAQTADIYITLRGPQTRPNIGGFGLNQTSSALIKGAPVLDRVILT